ncbi:MAG: hypothetical protein IPP59_02485 [Betaproteobacteria bacterium]|jgi:transposase-like protein|nr:hypothetical protein [Betaproteobacteria bacterium]MBK9783151.1 hypothetical protein [Candidatus Dechloromonas phosphorivorans]
MSKTQAALVLYEQGKSLSAAAKEAGIKPPTLHAAIKRRDEQNAAGKEHCPCCGQVVRAGFKIKETPK